MHCWLPDRELGVHREEARGSIGIGKFLLGGRGGCREFCEIAALREGQLRESCENLRR